MNTIIQGNKRSVNRFTKNKTPLVTGFPVRAGPRKSSGLQSSHRVDFYPRNVGTRAKILGIISLPLRSLAVEVPIKVLETDRSGRRPPQKRVENVDLVCLNTRLLREELYSEQDISALFDCLKRFTTLSKRSSDNQSTW